jgi:hypothetical protein
MAMKVTSISFAPKQGPFADTLRPCIDCSAQNLPIGFNFTFYGQTYTTFNLSADGFITFTPYNSLVITCCARPIPVPDDLNNLVAAAWTSLDTRASGGIYWETRGKAPHRYLAVSYENVPWDTWPDSTVTTQIVLYERTNVIEIHTAKQPLGHFYTQGLENQDGTEAAFIAGRVQRNYALASDAVRFEPTKQSRPR